MEHTELDTHDQMLIEAAREVIRRNYEDEKYTVGSAV